MTDKEEAYNSVMEELAGEVDPEDLEELQKYVREQVEEQFKEE